jgi:TetR/AcrR family transcriptional regulator, cholesterol catabolism regulator
VTPGQGQRRQEILRAATARFGRDGYEDTKWAHIAADVGVGPTALYHYFESKQHCLYEILGEAIEHFRSRFTTLTEANPDPVDALRAVFTDCFALSELEVLRNRLLVAEQGLLSSRRASSREEQARQAARARTRDLEFAYASFLSSAMSRGAIPATDPRMLARAVLGLYNSIWTWYRPHGLVELDLVRAFYVERMLAVVGAGAQPSMPQRLAA